MVTRILLRLSLSSLLILATACANQASKDKNSQPAWVMGKSETYPRKRFLLGVGEGDTMSDAKSRARAELASNFQVNINSLIRDNSQFESSASGTSTLSSKSQVNIEREIQSTTQQILEGVEIAETWQDPNSKRYFSLATISRMKAGLKLRQEIESIDQATRALVNQSKRSASLFDKARLSGEAIQLQEKRAVLNGQLQVVSATGNGIDAPWSVRKMKADRAALLSSITIKGDATGFEAQQLKSSLEDSLANDGFTVSPKGNYVVKVDLNAVPLAPNNGWYYSKAMMSVSIYGEDQRSLGGHQWNFKVSARQARLTDVRVLEKAQALLKEELTQELFNILK